MLEFIEPITTLKHDKMAPYERELLNIACRKVLMPHQRLFKTIVTLTKFEKFDEYSELL